jgi:predicted CoA-binding protein
MNTNLITDFLKKQNVFAVIGVSRKPAKYGHQVYKDLKEAGYVVYAVNPNIDTVSGDRCYHSLSELPEKTDVVDIVVPPKVTERVVEECNTIFKMHRRITKCIRWGFHPFPSGNFTSFVGKTSDTLIPLYEN